MGARFTLRVCVFSLLVPVAATGFDVYTLGADLPFEVTIPSPDSVVRGTFHAVSEAEFASWDLSTFGQDADAAPDTHACADLGFNPFASCPFVIEGAGDQSDAVVFRLSLDADSGTVSQTGPSFSTFVDDAFGGSAYIIPADEEDRIPTSSSGGFLNFTEAVQTDSSFYVQPGESTAWLISRYEVGEVAAALAGGATLRMFVRDNSDLTFPWSATTDPVNLVALPEPETQLARALGLGTVLLISRVRRRRPAAKFSPGGSAIRASGGERAA